MRTFAITTLAIALLALMQGCDSIIERTEPSTSISQEAGLSTPGAVRSIRASMYDRMHSSALSTDWLLGSSALADDTYFRANRTRHSGLNRNLDQAGLGTGAYGVLYNLINDANILISGIEDGVLPEDEATQLRGEAYFMRALAMHHAVRVFGYEPGVTPASGDGEGFDLGIEMRLEPTLDVGAATSLARSTVPEVYTQIVDDLGQAISLLGQTQEGSPFYASEAAAQALLARVHLYQREWQAADDAATEALDLAASTFGSGLAGPSELANIFDETAGTNPEAIFTIQTLPIESAGVNNSIAAYTSQEWMAQVPTQDLISIYEPGDARLDVWFDPCFDEIEGEDPGGCDAVNDDNLELHKYSAEQGQYADNYIHLRVAEMVLIQAEARLNTSGIGPAINRLNDLRAERDASTLDPNDYTNEDEVRDEILDERRRELVAEGHRFFDLKRLGRDIQKAQGRAPVPFSSYRILDDFPESQLEVNELLEQNPGY